MDLDSLLSLEEQYYKEGYDEGRRENLQNNLVEGKQYGLQVGFQRYSSLGHMKGICDYLKLVLHDTPVEVTINELINMITRIPLDNSNSSATEYEQAITRVRNKFRLLLLTTQKHLKKRGLLAEDLSFDQFTTINKIIAGELRGFTTNDSEETKVTFQDQTQMW
ncbi:AFR654Wp [Eremothecium gossypii ATCC 10895]|uniref:AFR654Wp n=1 Tax=Eremothecium gossypii (strain ATCC 10895 / CBS 109.51 / FGSC 9923 / NRRL Y-1056) TaxID=284811 RepID=Q752C1_EREGS|nr:AFR654Wp [Eremothecium gossypii ATCC 10895]AAS54026.1 AFR654Wp [Eremothecium gossypii ATCC 10895]AEY98341.1 FAFR654Wp [Eremothecium gossypii FDAG1]